MNMTPCKVESFGDEFSPKSMMSRGGFVCPINSAAPVVCDFLPPGYIAQITVSIKVSKKAVFNQDILNPALSFTIDPYR